MNKFSVVTPVYGCKESLIELSFRIDEVMRELQAEYELILIDDFSPDNAWETIQQLSIKNKNIKGIKLSRNFGQHKAIFAGLEKSTGEWVIVLDCDLQDKPEEIIKLYNTAIKNSCHVVLGRRAIRQDSFIKRWLSSMFYRLLGYLTDTTQDSSIANFGIYHRKVINSVLAMGDTFKYFPAMVKWVGFRTCAVDISHDERKFGKTSYSYRKLLHLGLEVILAFSEKPLRLTVKMGFLISTITFIALIITFIKYLEGKIVVLGYASQILSIWFFGGITIFILGIVGLYIGKSFEKVKGRPSFIIDEQTENV